MKSFLMKTVLALGMVCGCLGMPFLGLGPAARAEEPSVNATLSSARVTLGEPVELQLEIRGGSAPKPPITAEGLSIQPVGESTQMQLINGDFRRSVVLTYQVQPLRSGTFTVPAVPVEVGGKKLATRPLTLVVDAASNPPAGGAGNAAPAGAAAGNEQRLIFAEWVLPKTTGYVGEALPAELRLYVDAQVRANLQQMPSVNADGFTVQRFPQPQQTTINRDGRNYNLLIFKTALIPVKSGSLTLPAAAIDLVAAIPQQQRARRPRLPGGMPDPFSDPFFEQFVVQQQAVKAQAAPVALEVKPLPAAGRPKAFSGAVGTFTMTTKATPTRVKTGDPVTLMAEIAGLGSFDRVEAPRLEEVPGWRAYPPSTKFQADDAVGISGRKTFETALIADQAQDRLPRLSFVFFDPIKEQYVTLTDDSNAVTVEGAAVASTPTPASPATAAASPAASPKAAPAVPTVPAANDIFHIQTESRGWGASFAPLWEQQRFWLLQLVPLAGLLAVGSWGWARRRAGREMRNGAQARALAEIRRTLHDPATEAEAFYAAAVRQVQLAAAPRLAAGVDPATLDGEAIGAALALDENPELEAAVRSLFAEHDAFRYARTGGGTLPPEQRAAVLALLERLDLTAR